MKLLALLLGVCALVATVSACDCATSGTICLSEEQIAKRVVHLEMLPGRMGNHSNGGGIVVMDVTIGTDGKVLNATLISGHPIAASLLMGAVPKWRFKPFVSNGSPRMACGRSRLEFSIVENQTSVTVAKNKLGPPMLFKDPPIESVPPELEKPVVLPAIPQADFPILPYQPSIPLLKK